MKIEIKNRWTNKVIFSHECDNNTLRKTILEAIKSGSDLIGANLRGSNLICANLRDANLSGANLSYSNLSYSDLIGANLSDANLRGANLSYSNLRGSNLICANLRDANLSGANLRGANLIDANLIDANKIPIFCKWSHGITNGNLIHIGCEKRTIEEFDIFFNSNDVLSTERNTDEFKQIQAVYEAYKAYLTFLNK